MIIFLIIFCLYNFCIIVLFRGKIICVKGLNCIHGTLLKNFYDHFYNLGIILLMPYNFIVEITNFILYMLSLKVMMKRKKKTIRENRR